MSLTVCFSRGEGGLFLLKGTSWVWRGGDKWRSFCMQGQLERTSNFHLHPKEALWVFFFFRYCYMALIHKFKSFILVSQIWKIKKRKGKYTVCFTWYLLSPSPGLPAVILTVMDDSQCWAVCETVWQLQQFVWYSHIHWPKSCIYTKSQVIGYKNYNS